MREAIAAAGYRLERIDEPAEKPKGALRLSCPFCRRAGRGENTAVLKNRIQLIEHINFAHPDEVGVEERGEMDAGRRESATRYLLRYLTQRGIEVPRTSKQASKARMQGLESSASEESDDEEIVERMMLIRKLISPFIINDPLSFFTVLSEHVESKNNRFRLQNKNIGLVLNSYGKAVALYGLSLSLMEALLRESVERMGGIVKSDDGPFYVSFAIEAPNTLDHPICSPFMPAVEDSISALMSDLSIVLTSKTSLLLDNQLSISVRCLGRQTAETDFKERLFGGRPIRRNEFASELGYCISRRGFFGPLPNLIFKSDCLLVGVALSILQKEFKGKRSFITSSIFRQPMKSKKLKELVVKLSEQFADQDFNQMQGHSFCQKMQDFLNSHYGLQLKIYNSHSIEDLFYKGLPGRKHEEQIHFILLAEHICWIYNAKSFFRLRGKCEGCLESYTEQGRKKHRLCSGYARFCELCQTRKCWRKKAGFDEGWPKVCTRCLISFRSMACFQNHESEHGNAASACSIFRICERCGMRGKRVQPWSDEIEEHTCLTRQCNNCKIEVNMEAGNKHYCPVNPASLKEMGIRKTWAEKRGIGFFDPSTGEMMEPSSQEPQRLLEEEEMSLVYGEIVPEHGQVWFDMETRVGDAGRLEVYAICALFACSRCCFINYMQPKTWPADFACGCGKRWREYFGETCLDDFSQELFFQKRHKNIVCYSFYGSGFDNKLLIDHALQKG